MNDTIFLYQGKPCQVVRHHSDTLLEIINPDTGRRKTVPARDVVAAPYPEHRHQKMANAQGVGTDKTPPAGHGVDPEVLGTQSTQLPDSRGKAKALTPPARGFTDPWLRSLRPGPKRMEVGDPGCRGLRLRVEPSGRRLFVWYYRQEGKTRVLTLGQYGTAEGCVSLKQARKLLEKAKQRHAAGIAPGGPEGAPKTVAELCELFYERRILPHRRRPDIVRQVLDHDIIPALGTRKLAHLTTPMVATAVERVVNRGAATHAAKSLAILKQTFRFAEARGYIDHNPAYALDSRGLGIVDRVRDRYLASDEIRAVWQVIDEAPRLSITVGVALKVLLLTGVRTGEALNARWEHLDMDARQWTIPRENTKTAEAWVVPLAPMVGDLFESLRPLRPDVSWVFAGIGDGPLDPKSLGHAARRLRSKIR
jgi:integrase